jgi:hypothetical protein
MPKQFFHVSTREKSMWREMSRHGCICISGVRQQIGGQLFGVARKLSEHFVFATPRRSWLPFGSFAFKSSGTMISAGFAFEGVARPTLLSCGCLTVRMAVQSRGCRAVTVDGRGDNAISRATIALAEGRRRLGSHNAVRAERRLTGRSDRAFASRTLLIVLARTLETHASPRSTDL